MWVVVQLMAALALPTLASTQHGGSLPTFRLAIAGPCIPAANYWGEERVAPLCAWHHGDESACHAAVDSEGFGACEYTGGEDWMYSFSHWSAEDWSNYHERLVAAHAERARAFLANVVVEWTDANEVEELDTRLLSHMESWLLVLSDDSDGGKLIWPSCQRNFDAHEARDGDTESTLIADCVTERSSKADELLSSAPTLDLLRELPDHREWRAFRTSVKRQRSDKSGEAVSSDAAYKLTELVRVWGEWQRWQHFCRT